MKSTKNGDEKEQMKLCEMDANPTHIEAFHCVCMEDSLVELSVEEKESLCMYNREMEYENMWDSLMELNAEEEEVIIWKE